MNILHTSPYSRTLLRFSRLLDVFLNTCSSLSSRTIVNLGSTRLAVYFFCLDRLPCTVVLSLTYTFLFHLYLFFTPSHTTRPDTHL